jgi:hypothetical protein
MFLRVVQLLQFTLLRLLLLLLHRSLACTTVNFAS